MAGDALQVQQFRYATDNLGYLIYGRKSAVAVDGGAVDAIFEFIKVKGLRLDYVTYSMQVAKLIEPSNSDIDHYLERYDPKCVFSCIEEERKVNPILRFNDPAIISILKANSLPHATEYERWVSIMSLP